MLASAFITSLFPFDVFIKLSQEDNLIENSQVVVLLLGAFWAFRFSRTIFRRKEYFHAAIFGLAVLGLVFVAGDEISWGQRIFHIETPKQIAEYNVQKEITIHNLSFFDRHVNTGYIAIGLYSAIMWFFPYIFSDLKKPLYSYYIPLGFAVHISF